MQRSQALDRLLKPHGMMPRSCSLRWRTGKSNGVRPSCTCRAIRQNCELTLSPALIRFQRKLTRCRLRNSIAVLQSSIRSLVSCDNVPDNRRTSRNVKSGQVRVIWRDDTISKLRRRLFALDFRCNQHQFFFIAPRRAMLYQAPVMIGLSVQRHAGKFECSPFVTIHR
jgi:hypothetical protein